MNTAKLPLTRSLTSVTTLAFIVALVMAFLSLAGLLFPNDIYPAEEQLQTFLSNDIVNLFIGLPILLGAIWFTWRGSLPGLLFLPGALFYVTYNSIAYAVAMLFSRLFVPYLALALLSAYAILRLLSSVDVISVQAQLKGRVAERISGGALVGFGILILGLAVGEILQSDITWAELSVRIADLLVAPFWVAGGILLWRKQGLGYVIGMGLLFQANMLFIGLFAFFILQPFVIGVPFPLDDFLVVAVMSLVCIVPFGLYVRGVISKRR